MGRWLPMLLWLASLASAGCDLVAGDWPDRANKTPDQMLTDVVRRQQQRKVRVSTGALANECFTDVDFEQFKAARRPQRVVERLKQAEDFNVMVGVLRTEPPDALTDTLRAARQIARPTWRQMGFIDRAGNGQTEAGHAAELMIAAAIVDAFAAEIGKPSSVGR